MRTISLFAILTLLLISCNKNNNKSNIPELEFIDLSETKIKAGDNGNLYIRCSFKDKDGDIPFGSLNLFLRDSRDTVWTPYLFPSNKDYVAPSNGLAGTILISYQKAFLLLRNDSLHMQSDTLHWDIYMKDKKGNVSNTVTTTSLILEI